MDNGEFFFDKLLKSNIFLLYLIKTSECINKGDDCADTDCMDKKMAKKCMETCGLCPEEEEEESEEGEMEEEEEEEKEYGELSLN